MSLTITLSVSSKFYVGVQKPEIKRGIYLLCVVFSSSSDGICFSLSLSLRAFFPPGE